MFDYRTLLIETCPIELARVKNILDHNCITYRIRTKRNQTRIGMMLHTQMITRIHNGASKFADCVDEMQYTYTLKVKRKDYESAKKLIGTV